MTNLDDFKEDNNIEDRVDGAEDYITEFWEDGKLNDPNENDNPEDKADTIPHEKTVDEIAKGNKEIEDLSSEA